MSVLDKEIVDGMAINEEEKVIRLLITDHLNWTNEYQHLTVLQEKINSYIAFCENQQYKQIYKNIQVKYAIFEIHFKFEPTIMAMNFLKQVQRQVNELGITLECHISERG